jgi:hypothetical protein
MDLITQKYSAKTLLRGVALCVGLMVVLSGCSNVKKSMGITKRSPDEFAVVSKAPLIMPPNYNLRPPRPGAPRPTELTPTSEARSVVFGKGKNKPNKGVQTPQQMAMTALDQNNKPAEPKSAGEIALLGQAGSDPSQANIRSKIRLETTGVSDKLDSIADRLLFWKEDPTDGGTVINAGKEAKRLKKLANEGKPASGSPAPVIRRKKQTLLEDVE